MKLSQILAGAAVAAVSALPAQAQSTYNLTDNSNPGACSFTNAGTGQGNGNVYSCAAQTSNTASLNIRAYNANGFTGSSTISTAAVLNHGAGYGLGAGNVFEGYNGAQSPNHAIDNGGTGFDFFVLEFTNGPVKLNNVTLGWSGDDADFQILAWAGVGAPSISGTVSSAFGANWTLTDTKNGAGGIDNPDVPFSVNSGNVSSKYWVISALSPSLGNVGQLSQGNDSFKVLSLQATVSTVPEPSTYALMAAGLVGIFGVARRRRQQA